MASGKAHGRDRSYQVACRDVLVFRKPTLRPYEADGIDVSFELADTRWTLDVVLRDTSGSVVVAECRRTKGAVKQDDLAAFAYKVERLRQALGTSVAGVFMTKTAHQVGAVRVGQSNGITLAVVPEASRPPGFSITFLRYDAEREKKLLDMIIHTPPASLALKGHAPTVVVGSAACPGAGTHPDDTNAA